MPEPGCPFYSKKIALSCYVFSSGRYKNLPDFIANNSAGISSFSIAGAGNIDCIDILDTPLQAAPNPKKCINCMFCVFGCPGNKFTISNTYQISSQCNDSSGGSDWGPLPQKVAKAFKGSLLNDDDFQSVEFFNPRGRYQGFDNFTSVDETKNIAVWLGNTIKFLLGGKSRVGLEIPVDIPGADRDGRLDVTGILDSYLISCETKTTFKDMMSDKRFVEQMSGYERKLRIETQSSSMRFHQFLVVGGAETDLLPISDPRCTSTIGGEAELFYRLLKDHQIRFISAKSFLVLGMKALLAENHFDLEMELSMLLGNESIGLLSCGPISP